MKWLKITPLLMLALAIDGFQFFVSIGLSAISAIPGTVGGCAVGAYYAGKVGCFVVGIIGSIPIVNGALATVTIPLGIVIGFAISICISFTLGSILVLFLELAGVLDRKAALMAYLGEVIPGLSALPAWTGLVIRCATRELKGEVLGGALKSVAGMAGALVLPNTPVGNAMGQRTLNDKGTIARAQPRYENAEQNVTRTESSRNIPMQDMRIRPATRTPTNNNAQPRIALNDNVPSLDTTYAKAA